MKKIYALLIFTLSCSIASAQYYVVSALNAGFNPGMLNTDIEEPHGALTPIGWTIIMGTTTTDTWSSAQTIPFSFQFNGQSYTSYMVSNTGVLTFTTSATTVPSSTNSTLPDASIPDNSIMVWGVNLSGANDAVLSKTFGTAPNRQHWINFASASATGASYSYWSIVLEESTNSFYIVDHRTDGGNVNLTGGIQLNSSTALMINGATLSHQGNGSNSVGDNTFYEFIAGTVQPLNDFEGLRSTMAPVIQKGSSVYVTGDFWNKGVVSAGSYDFNYRINGGATLTNSYTNAITPGSITNLFHPTQFNPTATGTYTIEMWLSNINGNADENPADDKITTTVSVVDVVPTRHVVFEEGTGTWCGWCPRGFVAMEHIKDTYPNAITIAVHNGDPMAVSAYDAGMGLSGYPGSRVDRGKEESVSVNGWDNLYTTRMGVVPIATVNIDGVWPYAAGNKIIVDMSADFIVSKTGADYRFITVITEDGVTGTTAQYAQRNYYANNAQGPMGGWESKPDPVPASQMVYDDVARSIYPSFEGQAGSVPSTITSGQTVTHQMVFSLPTLQSKSNAQVVVMLVDGTTGEVINAAEVSMENSVGFNENNAPEFNLYPNPANQQIQINAVMDASYEVYDLSGKVVAKGETFEKAAQINTADWTPGMYTVRLSSGSAVEVQKFTVIH